MSVGLLSPVGTSFGSVYTFLLSSFAISVNVQKFVRKALCLCLSVAFWSNVLGFGRPRPSPSGSRENVNASSDSARSHKLCFGIFRMFRSKRNCLIKNLSRTSPNEAQRTVEAVLRCLELSHLEALAISVNSQGAEEAPCIPLPVGEVLKPGRGLPHLLFCQLWRWADLRHSNELKQLPCCRTSMDSLKVCANPFHWSRLCEPDSPPPPYSLSDDVSILKEDSFASGAVSPNSGSGESSLSWCKLAYWELNNRVGMLLPFSQPIINVFNDLPRCDGLCLQTLADSQATNNPSILNTRSKIGQGITLFRQGVEVWLYNRSDYPVFLSSPTLDPPNTEKLTVYKLLAGYSIKIFDYERSKYNQKMRDPSAFQDGPFDPHAVRISFVKGWGSSRYSRRCVTSCPCWLEVIFQVFR